MDIQDKLTRLFLFYNLEIQFRLWAIFMAVARSTKIDLGATPFYHCVTRCVRRTYLCGKDLVTGKDYSHRKEWIVDRIKYLSEVFAIKVCAYAVMSNHYHIVLFVNEKEANSWDDEQVKSHWSAIFPKDAKQVESLLLTDKQLKEKIFLWRERLMSISWYMRCLNEVIAKESNREEDCTGRFWEGRFKSQALLDEGALLSAMAYVDLNPIRAKMALTPEGSDFTSIQERIKAVVKQLKKTDLKSKPNKLLPEELEKLCDKAKQPAQLMPFSHSKQGGEKITIDFKLSDYMQLIDYTGRILREDKRGAIPHEIAPIFSRLKINSNSWLETIKHLETKFFNAIGHAESLEDFTAKFRVRAPRGIGFAKELYLKSAA